MVTCTSYSSFWECEICFMHIIIGSVCCCFFFVHFFFFFFCLYQNYCLRVLFCTQFLFHLLQFLFRFFLFGLRIWRIGIYYFTTHIFFLQPASKTIAVWWWWCLFFYLFHGVWVFIRTFYTLQTEFLNKNANNCLFCLFHFCWNTWNQSNIFSQ